MGVESDSSDEVLQRAVPRDGTAAEPSAESGIKRIPLATPASGMAVPRGIDAAIDDDEASDAAVKWLLGAGLLRKVLLIARSFVSNELDLRDWMSQSSVADLSDGDELWFDYIADTGDDPRVMRSLATQFGRAFPANSLGTTHPKLPLGVFLFVGGDTAYHVADEVTIRRRFVEPLNTSHATGDARRSRPIFAIPGNHDYYDHLVGFNRLFRKPYPHGAAGVLGLTGFHSTQEASYIKILLPHGWQLWGVDLQTHGIDYRQRMYFRDGPVPDRLILCTPTPPVSYNRVLVDPDPENKQRKAYVQLLAPDPAAPAPGFNPAFTPDSGGELPPPGTCRLHLSGDDHHYARYNGQTGPGPLTPTSIATVVSGGGGAFTHPTEHSCGTVPAAVKYPDPRESRERTASALVNPLAVIRAGMLHVLGALMVWLFYCHWPENLESLRYPGLWTLCVIASLGLCVGSVHLARYLARRKVRHGKQSRRADAPAAHPLLERLWELSVFIAPLGAIAAVALPILLHPIVPEMDPLSGTSLWMVCATGLVIALVLLASLRGAAELPGRLSRVGLGVVGLAHAAMQLALPYLLISRGWQVAAVTTAAMLIVFAPLGKAMYRRAPAVLVTALWLVQGLGAIAVLYWGPWGAVSAGWWSTVLAWGVGAFVVPMQFGFYLLTCGAWSAHNNEAGITARATACKQWIRFHVTRDALTGYVIGIDDPTVRRSVPRLVDRFVIAPAPASPPAAPAPADGASSPTPAVP